MQPTKAWTAALVELMTGFVKALEEKASETLWRHDCVRSLHTRLDVSICFLSCYK